MQETKKLFSNSLVIFLGAIIGSLFSYLFNMMMGRMLGPDQYGEMVALMSLLVILSVGGGAIQTITTKYSSDLFHHNYMVDVAKLFKVLSRYVFWFSIGLFFIGLVLSQRIAEFFSIESIWPVILTLTSFIFGYLIVISRGILQGTQNFVSLSGTNAIEMILRFVLGLFFVKFGFALNGAIGAIVLATAITYLFMFPSLQKLFKKSDNEKSNFKFNHQEIINYAWPTFLSSLLLMVAMNIDIIMVKHYFLPNDAGLYAAVSTVGKIVLFLTSPIVMVMFPMIAEQKIKGYKHYKIFLFSLLITLMGSLVVLGIYLIAPAKILTILYGSQYTHFYYLLPEIGTVMLFYALINLLANYFLAIKDFTFLVFFAVSCFLQIVSIALWHPTIQIVVRLLIANFGLLFFSFMAYYLWTKRQQILSSLGFIPRLEE